MASLAPGRRPTLWRRSPPAAHRLRARLPRISREGLWWRQAPAAAPGSAGDEQDLRAQAIKRIERRRKFLRDLVFFLVVNAALWGIWALKSTPGNGRPLAGLGRRHLGCLARARRLEGLRGATYLRCRDRGRSESAEELSRAPAPASLYTNLHRSGRPSALDVSPVHAHPHGTR